MNFWLDCLGGLAMSQDGVPVRLSARKARILLGLLASARRRTMPRQRLAALLWETSDTEQARVSLRQALSQIRRAGGDGWIDADGDDLHLGSAVGTDLDAFHAALARNDTAEAARLYRGPFLDGLDVASSGLGLAISAERARLTGLASDALARELQRVGDGPEASALAHRLLGLDPLDEAAHRRLMQIDASRGMRGAARVRYEALETALRRDLGSEPEPETRTLYERIRRGAGGSSSGPDPAPELGGTAEPEPVSGFLLLGMETDTAPDWTALRQAAGAAGATEEATGPGEMAWHFLGLGLRDVSSVGLQLAELAGKGLSFGLTVSDGSNGPAGRSLIQARRLAALAEPGDVLVAHDLATRLGLAAEPGQRAVPLCRNAVRARPQPPMIGRDGELAQIEAAMTAAQTARKSLAVHLSGEAGIGKSRLATEVTRRAATSGMATSVAGFDAFSPGSRHLAQRLVAGLSARPAPDPDASTIEEAIWSWLTDPETAIETELRMSALDHAAQQSRILDVLASALRRVSGVDGLLIVIEDCHWRPDGAGDFILELLNRLLESRVVFLLTERPHAASLDHRLATRARSGLARITLAPLPPEVARELVLAIAPDFAAAEAAIDRAAGHPLFLIRLLESSWTGGALPASVTELVQEQIERLPDAERASLRKAAILGTGFDPNDAAAIFPETARPRPSGDLLYETDTGLAFGHDLVHRAIYESIPPDTRQQWHARAAAHYRGLDPILWADHALKTADDAEAGQAAVAAANAMVAARRFPAAFPYIEAGLARDGDPEASAELHSCRAGIRRIRGDMAGALDDYRAAHASATRAETRAAMLCRQALVLHRLGRGDEADRALDAAEEIADAIGLTGLGRAEIHEQRGNRAFVRGDHATCMMHHQASLAAAEATGDPRGIARGHGGIGDAAYAAGRFRTAYGHFTKAIENAEQACLGLVREEYLFMQAFSYFFAEPGPHAHLMMDIAVDSAIQCGAARIETVAREVRAEMRVAAGDLAGATEDIQAIDRLATTQKEIRISNDVEIVRIFVALRSGDPDRARELLKPLLRGAETNADIGATALGLSALLAADHDERDAALAKGMACCAANALSHSVIWFHACALERAIVDRDQALAGRHIDALTAFAADEPIGIVPLYTRTAELVLWPSSRSDRDSHAAVLRDACLGDVVRLLAEADLQAADV